MMPRTLYLLGILVTSLAVAKQPKPTFILVHGALLTSTGWAKLQNHLQNKEYNVVTLDVPGRMDDGVDAIQIDLEVAASKVCQVVALQANDVILVGHGEGGAIITQAHSRCSNKIKALVYLAAIVPLDGETSQKQMEAPRDGFSKCLVRDEKNQILKVSDSCQLSEMYFNDLKESEKKSWLATLVMHEPLKISTTAMKLHTDGFNDVPKYYIEATEDKMLTIESQKEIQKRIKWTNRYELKTGHCPFVSKPRDLGAKLIEIADTYIKR